MISFQEAFGRYLDLHELYNEYINSKFGEPIEYAAYLDVFSQPHKIPRKLKLTRWNLFTFILECNLIILTFTCFYLLSSPAEVLSLFKIPIYAFFPCRQYREYLENLLEYLIYFFERTEPLLDLDRIFTKVCFSLVHFLIFLVIVLLLSHHRCICFPWDLLYLFLFLETITMFYDIWPPCAISKCDTCVNLPEGLLHIKWYLIAPFLWREKMLLHDLFFLNLQQSAKIFEFESCDNLSWDCWQPYHDIICTCCRFYVNPVACETFCSKIQILAQSSVLMARDSYPYAICIVSLIFFEFFLFCHFWHACGGILRPNSFFL